jgi:hypothetical protein
MATGNGANAMRSASTRFGRREMWRLCCEEFRQVQPRIQPLRFSAILQM